MPDYVKTLGGKPSNASVPSAVLFSVVIPTVCDNDSRKIFGVLPTKVTRDANADGSFDPTNDLAVSDSHITLAWGRDYGHVTPVKGISLGGGQTVSVEVYVRAGEA